MSFAIVHPGSGCMVQPMSGYGGKPIDIEPLVFGSTPACPTEAELQSNLVDGDYIQHSSGRWLRPLTSPTNNVIVGLSQTKDSRLAIITSTRSD
jgi:hypothetical protein